MNEILKNLVVIGVEGEARLEQMRELLDAQGDAYAFIDAHSPAGITLCSDWAARPLPQAYYNGRLEFYTIPACRKFLKKHGAELPEELGLQNEINLGAYGANPFQVFQPMEGGIPAPMDARVRLQEALMGRGAPRAIIDDLRMEGDEAAPFLFDEENDDDI